MDVEGDFVTWRVAAPVKRVLKQQAGKLGKPWVERTPRPPHPDQLGPAVHPPEGLFRGVTARVLPTSVLSTRGAFNAFASSSQEANGMPEVKFLYDRHAQKLFFIPNQFEYHFDFASQVLGLGLSAQEFTDQAYNSPDRQYIAGTVTAYDGFFAPDGKKGLYAMSFWPTDEVHEKIIDEAFEALKTGLPFAKDQEAYHPGGQSQEQALDADGGADRKALEKDGVPIFTNAELTQHFRYMALNPGSCVGTLRVIRDLQEPPPGRRDVAFYQCDLPTDVPPVAGLGTAVPQTYLSHTALKARQDHTPYAYQRDLVEDPAVATLENQLVCWEVDAQGAHLRPATAADEERFFQSHRPSAIQVLKTDRKTTEIRPLDDISFADSRAYGTKTCNVAELHRLERSGSLEVSDLAAGEPQVIAPDGFGIPAMAFLQFMEKGLYDPTTTFDQRLTQLLTGPEFQAGGPTRDALLADFQEKMLAAPLSSQLTQQLDALSADFQRRFPGRDLRLRSSSDSEDLQGFSGAGLFDSYTCKLKDAGKPGGSLADRLKKVFASTWNARAVAEFDYYRIEPHSVAMAELVMPNTSGELANGVVRWGSGPKGWDSMVLNAQTGDDLVTNPKAGSTPDVIRVGNYGFHFEPEIIYDQKSNQPLLPGRAAVLTDPEIRAHFAQLYGKQNDPTFSIECEFKIQADGKLLIKQARPWVS